MLFRSYLIQILQESRDAALEMKVRQSLDFLAGMIMKGNDMKRYYAIAEKRWLLPSGMTDYAHVAKLYADAASYFQDPRYTEVAVTVLRATVAKFLDEKKGIFIDAGVDLSTNVEYLMEMNGLFAQSIMALDAKLGPTGRIAVESLMTYFSQMGDPLEDHLWHAADWEFAEGYVPYLRAVDVYLPVRNQRIRKSKVSNIKFGLTR